MKDTTQELEFRLDSRRSIVDRDLTRAATWEQVEGSTLPLGCTWIEEEQAFNFAVYAEHAASVTLLLYAPPELVTPAFTYSFDFLRNKSGRIWHCRIPITDMEKYRYYAYSVSGEDSPGVHSFDPQKVLLDPYANAVFFPPEFDRTLAMREGSNAGRAPLGVLPSPTAEFDWGESRPPLHEADAIIYELHVRGFTRNPNSGVDPSRAGTYSGLVEKIPYLKDLGVTVVELMPIFQRDPQEGDYWGYMPLNFFSPHAQYADNRDLEQHFEFKNMVKAFHEAGFGIVLDVVYNHTCEGDHRGPIYSYKGLGSASYYMMTSDPAKPYANYSGTGNTLNFGRSHVRSNVVDALIGVIGVVAVIGEKIVAPVDPPHQVGDHSRVTFHKPAQVIAEPAVPLQPRDAGKASPELVGSRVPGLSDQTLWA